jgi:hypothetical protein
MAYDLWETDTNNIIATFDTEEEALAAIREEVEAYGPQYVETWLLIRVPHPGVGQRIAAGRDLAQMATAIIAER